MLTGVVYTLIGIRTKRLHIFLSTAYLVSLAVTVLVIYVMHPPISSAIQAAYFVAALVTGMIFGAGSVVFADITECLGCLFGGFSLGMWFMVLRPGGLVRSTVGKIVLIACFSLGVSGLYFHRLTRPYGLIGSISFAGATVIVIGIDCFSRAGLKEFWMYIWSKLAIFQQSDKGLTSRTDLNSNVFPPHYSGPYPVTRGIRVEIAAIVLLFLIGIMSQMKIWNVIKKRRDRQEAHRLAEERRQEKAESDLGRKLEEGNMREKIRWEAVYGGRKPVDSGLSTNTASTPRKASTSASGGDEYDKGSTDSATHKEVKASDFRTQEPSRITVRVASEDSIYEIPSSTSEDLFSKERREQGEFAGSSAQADANGASRSRNFPRGNTKMPDVELRASPPETNEPGFAPLPFNVSPSGTCNDDDRSSVATFAASDRFPGSWSSKQRFSASDPLTDLSQMSRQKSNSSAHDKGEASSVAATGDDSGDNSSSRENVSELEDDASPFKEAEADETKKLGDDAFPLTVENLEANKATSTDARRAASILPEGIERLYKDDEAFDRGRGYLEKSLKPSSPPPAIPERSPSRVSEPKSKRPQEQPTPDTLHDQLPEEASKVVMAYRTNEWAKHLEKAEAPAIDDLKRHPQRSKTDAITAEPAAPVHVKALQQTPLTAEPAPIKFRPSVQKPEVRQQEVRQPATSRNSLPSQQKRPEQRTDLRRSSMGNLLLDRSSSQVSLSRRNHRSSSSPLAESPIDENVEMSFPKRMSAHPTNSLMAHRSSTLQTRYSSNSLVRANSSNSIAPVHPQNLQTQGPDHIPNAHRQSPAPQNIRRNSSRPILTPRTSATFVSPPPPQRRETLAANWRSSLQQDPAASNQALSHELEGRQTDLLMQQRRASAGIQAAQMESYMRRENEINRRMSSGDLLEAHQRVMRRMQGSVKH